MKRREFLSFMPFVAMLNKPKLTTDFESFKSFVKEFEKGIPDNQLHELYCLSDSNYKSLYNAVNGKNVQIFYTTAARVMQVLEPFGMKTNNYTCALSHSLIPLGYILTVFKFQKVVGKIQFIKL